MNTNGRFFLISLSIVALDQITKLLVEKFLPRTIQLVPDFLSIVYTVNYGGGFGILQGMRWFLVLASLLFVGAVLVYLKKIEKGQIVPLALVFGGAVGNLIDRIVLGGVLDFIAFDFWPAFNVADSAITIGVIWIIIISIKK